MASDWIPVSTNIHTKPEVLRVASASGRSRFEVVGLLSAFWSWASDHSEDGQLEGIFIEHLETLIGADSHFWKQVESVGWLKITRQGLAVPCFEKWLSRGAKRRAKERDRKQSARDADEMRTTGQDNTEQDSSYEESNGDAATEALFVDAWNSTEGVRKSLSKRLTKKRRTSFRARLREPGWDWQAALKKFPLPCTRGDPDPWIPDLDWFLKPDSVLKILEGKYDFRKRTNGQFGGLAEFAADDTS